MEEITILSKNIDKLARNPLGIIALFIVLVYGIAGIVLGVSGSHLSEIQKTIFVCFLVVFPCLVLGSFLWLVAKHHRKLYAPSDYRNDEGFLGLLTPEQQKQKLDKEVEEVFEKESGDQSTHIELPPRNVVRNSVYLAEDLAIREIETEFNTSINRQVNIGYDSGIDGVFVRDNQGVGIEIKYALKPLSRNLIANQLRSVEESLSKLHWKKFSIILAIVFDDIDQHDIKKEKERLSLVTEVFPFKVDVRFYGLSQLKKKYGLQ